MRWPGAPFFATSSNTTTGAGCRTSRCSTRLVTEKLKVEAEKIAAEGWKWIEVAIGFPYGYDDGLRQLEGTLADMTAEEHATIDALHAEQAKLEAEYQDADELPDEVDVRLAEIEEALSAFETVVRTSMIRPRVAPSSWSAAISLTRRMRRTTVSSRSPTALSWS
jgi:hypothetical protein